MFCHGSVIYANFSRDGDLNVEECQLRVSLGS